MVTRRPFEAAAATTESSFDATAGKYMFVDKMSLELMESLLLTFA